MIPMLRTLTLISCALFVPGGGDEPVPGPPMAFEIGGGVPALLIPRDEHLEFGVHVAVGPVGATVGSVTIDSGVDPYVESMVLLGPARTAGAAQRETGWLRAKAEGSYLWYSMETVLDSRYLPAEWPSISHFYRQSGSENRRRESLIGQLAGRGQTAYRADTRHGAPEGKRIWKAAVYRDVPEGTIDMLGAVYLARVLVKSGKEKLTFPLLDTTSLWKMTLERGEEKRIEVPFGTFDAIEIKLIPGAWPGEPEVEPAKFKGLFGIRGSIHLWVDKAIGVPLRIEGSVPAGPVTIDCDIYLIKATGMPEALLSVEQKIAKAGG